MIRLDRKYANFMYVLIIGRNPENIRYQKSQELKFYWGNDDDPEGTIEQWINFFVEIAWQTIDPQFPMGPETKRGVVAPAGMGESLYWFVNLNTKREPSSGFYG